MSYIPKAPNHESYEYGEIPKSGGSVPSITIYALKENKRPVGFAPWPEPTAKPKKRKKAKP